jgi:uncharacterized delta-60 repeat protein
MFMSLRTAILATGAAWLGCASVPVHADGGIDTSYASGGRAIVGFIESDSVQLRALARSPFGARWMFGDDIADRRQLYISRSLANGNPDPGFGPGGSGQTRIALPANLIPQTEAWAVEGALVQADGKPIVFGGLRAVNGETGVFPGLVCRLAVAGNLDGSFNGGCAQLRSFLGAEESCLVADVAVAADGKLTVVGNCVGPSFAARPFITRLMPNGSIDFEFGAGAGLVTPLIPQALLIGQHFSAVALRPDGLAVVAGHFATSTGTRPDRDAALLQFDGGGSLDTTFGIGGVRLLAESGDTDEFARDVVLRADGRALLLAQREVVDLGNGRAGEQAVLMQVQADGALDPAFGSGGVVVDALDGRLGVGSTLRGLALDINGRPLLAGRRVAPSASPAQAGTDFWLAIPFTVPPQADTQLLISAETATSGYVLNTALNIRLPFSVTPGQATVVTVPFAIELDGLDVDGVFDKGLRVTAEAPITLNVLSGRSFATDGSQILPARLLGTEHRIASWGFGAGAGSSFAVVASANGTVITVTPAVSSGIRPAGVPFQVNLQQGQVYRLRVSPPGDLSGSAVSANRPVAVLANHPCAIIEFSPTPNQQCGGIVEQMAPVNRWGQDFLVVPTRQRPSGDVVRVYAQQSNTVVSLDGQAAAVIGPAGFFTFTRNTPTRITSSAPVSVMRYAQSCRVDFPQDPCIGDGFMLGVAPLALWQSRFSVVAPDRDFIGDYLHTLEIIAPLAQVANVRVDGLSVPAASFIAIGTSGFAYAQVTSTSGAHRVSAPAPISVSAYGMLQASSEGYAFPAAADAAGGDADADDLVARYTPGGQRDARFGSGGVVLVDHRAAYGASLPSFDSATTVLVDADGILVGTASQNGDSGQSLLVTYRLQGGSIFADGFEGN